MSRRYTDDAGRQTISAKEVVAADGRVRGLLRRRGRCATECSRGVQKRGGFLLANHGERDIMPCMRFIYVATAVGMAIAGLMGASPALADTGAEGYAQCVGGDTKPPPPGVSAEDWFPSVHVIDVDFVGFVPSEQIIQRLVTMGVPPKDAATRVHCYLANLPH
jgi:hypothetical protein